MIAVGMLGAWAGYAVLTWGYVLVRGWDIPLTQWVNPFHPYTWPKPPGTPPLIPSDQLTPAPSSSAAGQTGGQGKTASAKTGGHRKTGGGGGGARPRSGSA